MDATGRRTALVTGGSRGIGRGICLELARRGYRIAVNYARSEGAAAETLALVESLGGQGITVQGDIASAADRERLVDTVITEFGGIDVLVNNAGVAPRQRMDILEATESEFDFVLDTNLKGPYFLTQKVAKLMIQQVEANPSGKRPVIVNIGSISADTVSLNRGEYCISKAGVAMMTKLWAARLAQYGICVYELRPGVIATDMTAQVKAMYDAKIADGLIPIKRWGQPEDIGKAVAAIAEGAFAYSTGETIWIDGGMHIPRL